MATLISDSLKQAMIDRPDIFGGIYQPNVVLPSPPQQGPFPNTPNTMLYSATVEKVENGFILRVIHKQGDVPKVYVAHNADELKDLFIAAIVAERVSR